MKVSDIRRVRLKAWYANRSLPEREKSYISQLINGKASFGEKAARRLERDYGMPEHYLDSHDNQTIQQHRAEYITDLVKVQTGEEASLLVAYRLKSRAEQKMILKLLDVHISDFAKSA